MRRVLVAALMAEERGTLQQIVKTAVGRAGWRYTDEVYNRRWLKRVRENSKVCPEKGCWLYQGFLNPIWGYAGTSYRSRQVGVHRKTYELMHGITLDRTQYVCHTCDVRHCCNPDHLWLGTNSENQRDSSAKARHYESRRTHCERGHEFTPDNTYYPKTGRQRRSCKICERGRMRMKAGWPEELAFSHPTVPHGRRVGGGHFPRKRR